MATDYTKVVMAALKRIKSNRIILEALQDEQEKLSQFVTATIPLLPQEIQEQVMRDAERERDFFRAKAASLSEAVRNVLRNGEQKWVTVAEVRDAVVRSGFDFSKYTSNPLASISTTLKRMLGGEDPIETANVEGVTVYRWCGAVKPEISEEHKQRTERLKEALDKQTQKRKRKK